MFTIKATTSFPLDTVVHLIIHSYSSKNNYNTTSLFYVIETIRESLVKKRLNLSLMKEDSLRLSHNSFLIGTHNSVLITSVRALWVIYRHVNHTYIHTYIHTYAHAHTRTHARTHTHTRACARARTHTYVHRYVHACMHARTHVSTHAHTYTHKHVHACVDA